MRKNSIYVGLLLIGISIFMVASSLGFIPHIPWFKILCLGIFSSYGLRALVHRDFFGIFMATGFLLWTFEHELGIADITPFPLLIAAAMTGIGLNMIFGKKKKIIQINYKDGDTWRAGKMDDICGEEWKDGRKVILENNFNSTSKYVNSAAFSSAVLENNFGSANVYFNNATIYEREAVVELENNFGQMNIYFPKNWRASISQESAFGRVNVFGEPNRDMDAPCVIVKAESNFGMLNIYFE